jgi:hypothetical protein
MIKKILFVIAISFLLLIPTVFAQEPMGDANGSRKKPWLKFDSELEISFNTSAVNNASFQPDGPPVSIPLYIKYRVDIPNFLLRPPFIFLKRWFVFGRLIFPTQKILLSIINPPEWAAIAITPSTPYIDVNNNEFSEATAVLQIALHSDAPAEGYTLEINAEAPRLGKILEKDASLDIIFQPAWVPLLDIYGHSYIRTPPNETTTTTINITNLGNHECLVIANFTEISGWSIYLDPSQLWLSIGQTKPMTLLFKPPENFQGIQEINFTFTQLRYPGDNGPTVPFTIHAYFP